MGENSTQTPYEAAMAWRKRAGIDSPPVEVDREDGAETVTLGEGDQAISLRRVSENGGGLFVCATLSGKPPRIWIHRTELAALLPSFVNVVAYGTLADPSAYQPGEYPAAPASDPTSTALRAPQFAPDNGEVLHATPSDLAGLAAREAHA